MVLHEIHVCFKVDISVPTTCYDLGCSWCKCATSIGRGIETEINYKQVRIDMPRLGMARVTDAPNRWIARFNFSCQGVGKGGCLCHFSYVRKANSWWAMKSFGFCSLLIGDAL